MIVKLHPLNETSMTLEDLENGNMKNNRDPNIGSLLAAVVRRAEQENRLTCGMISAVKMLELEPEKILVCVLPQNQVEDSASHIHYVLLEAFCYENDIHMIKVDCSQKLAKMLNSSRKECDCACVLVHKPRASEQREQEDSLVDFCDRVEEDETTQPVIELPVL